MSKNFKKADERGVPSLIWQAGQDRRLEMIKQAAQNHLTPKSQILINGCGLGLYNKALLKFTPKVHGIDVEAERVQQGASQVPNLVVAMGEYLPYATNQFDLILSHEVIEHVQNDQQYATEMIRVLKPGGRAVIFCPNRLYPFETHGYYWQGKYYFGNIPLINYLPDFWRNQLAPHVRAYTRSSLRLLFTKLPIQIVQHTQIYPGYDKLKQRRPKLGKWLQQITYTFEKTPLKLFGLSHLLVIEKLR